MWIMCKVFSHRREVRTSDEFYLNFLLVYLFTLYPLLFHFFFFSLSLSPAIFYFPLVLRLPRQLLAILHLWRISPSSLLPCFLCMYVCVCAHFSIEARELCRLFWRLKWQMWVLLREKYMIFTCMYERWESLKYFALFLHFPNDTRVRTTLIPDRFLLSPLFSRRSPIILSAAALSCLFFFHSIGFFSSICSTFNGETDVSCIQYVSKSVFQSTAIPVMYVVPSGFNREWKRVRTRKEYVSNHLVFNILILAINV